MTLQQVSDFLAVVQHGSLHAAARSTGRSQPALTKSLARLERALGAPLFDRHTRGMQANQFGKRLSIHARRLVLTAPLNSIASTFHIKAGQTTAASRGRRVGDAAK